MVNAGITDVGLIVHANYQSLLDHVGSGKDWDLSPQARRPAHPAPLRLWQSRRQRRIPRPHGRPGGRATPICRTSARSMWCWPGGDMAVNLPVAEVFQQHHATAARTSPSVCTQQLQGRPQATPTTSPAAPMDWMTDVCPSIPLTRPTGCESLEVYILSKKLLLALVDYCAAHNIPSFSTGRAPVHGRAP